jgi:hypothetical protein
MHEIENIYIKKVNDIKSLFHQGIGLLSRTIFDSELDICKIQSTPYQK